jgi:hypothetical protein
MPVSLVCEEKFLVCVAFHFTYVVCDTFLSSHVVSTNPLLRIT